MKILVDNKTFRSLSPNAIVREWDVTILEGVVVYVDCWLEGHKASESSVQVYRKMK